MVRGWVSIQFGRVREGAEFVTGGGSFHRQRFARFAGTLRFSRQVARSQTRGSLREPLKQDRVTCRCDARHLFI